MEPIRILKLTWWPLILLVSTLAKGQDQHAGPPDIMMYYNFKQSQVTCVAGTNTYGNAIIFNIPYEYSVTSVFQYKDRNGNNIEEMICDYEGNVDQQCNPKFTTIMRSGKHRTSPVTDERWNKFETQYIDAGKSTYSYMYPINETNFHISFSVKSRDNAQILLCNSKGRTPKYSPAKCYWIVFPFLRKCSNGVPDYLQRNDNSCETVRVYKEGTWELDKWIHFTVTRENGSTIKLWESTHRTPILEYTDKEPIDIERLYIRDVVNAEWKIHDCRYLVITKIDQYIQLGTQFSFSRPDTLCISLYVAVCSRCAMEIIIRSDRKTEATRIVKGKQGLFIPWQLEKIEVQVHSNITYTLHILATAEAGATDTFWAVDDIRRCYETTISSTQVTPREINIISCESLQYPEWTFTKYRDTNNSTALGCSDSRFTGTYCNISCKSVLGSDYCENNMICRPTGGESETTQCICAPNSSDPTCSTECSYGYFGYNCQNKCGKCQGGTNRCDKISGKCSQGCEEGYTPPLCINTTGPVLLVPPTVVSVSYASVTLRLDNIATLGDWRADTFQIEYKLAGSARSWQQDTRRVELAENIEVTVPELERETTYSIRVVLYAFNGDTYSLENVPYTNATTTCQVNRMVNIEPAARLVVITLENNEEGCLIKNYFVRLASDNKRLYFTRKMEVIPNLKPFTNYTIIIGNYLYPEYNYTTTFTTMEAAPSDVPILKFLHTSDTTITVTWDVSLEDVEYLRDCTVLTNLERYFDCPWAVYSKYPSNFDSILLSRDNPSEFRITDLHPFARYIVRVNDKAVGTVIYGSFNTLSSNHVSDLELPNNVTVDSYSRNVIIRWIPPTCVNILGPLRYIVSITCVGDPWCDQVIPVTREFNAFSNYVSVDILTPFTNYRLELRATRNGAISKQNITVHFRTKEAAPPEVRSLKVYSRYEYSISLRWLAPYPPYGTLEYYDVVYCYIVDRLLCDRYERVYPVPCSLWDEDGYVCFDIKYIPRYIDFKIFVRAKNTGIIAYGVNSTIDSINYQSSPSVPLNFHATWNQNMLTLHWNCPDLPGGPLKYFRITLRQFDTEISGNKGQNQEYKLEVDNQPLRKNYNYSINQTIPASTSYKITVCGVNWYNGTEANLDVYTSPTIPVLAGDIGINSEDTTATAISISIPGVQANTTSRTSYVYVIVSKQTSNNITKRDPDLPESSEKEEILQFAPRAGDTWIAVEFQSRDSNRTFIVGSNSCTHSEHLKEDLINKPLTPAGAYNITIVLMNVYRDKRSYNDYTVSINSSSAGRYALLSLLLCVPPFLYLLYRLFRLIFPWLLSALYYIISHISQCLSGDSVEV